MIEFVIGLVSILALVAGLLQLTSLSTTQLQTMTDARRNAADQALASAGSSEAPAYISDWNPGQDGRTYSRDDEFNLANQADFHRLYLEHIAAAGADWDVMEAIPDNPVNKLRNTPAPVEQFGLVKGRATHKVALLPAVRHLLYNSDSIEIDSTVWMTETAGFY